MKPKVILYTATSLDGRTSGFPVDMGVFYSLAQQWSENASLVGCDTLLSAPDEILKDEGTQVPEANPDSDDARPILVVPDSRGRLKSWHYWRKQPYWKDFISLCTQQTTAEHLEYLSQNGVKFIQVGEDHIDFGKALEILNSRFKVTIVRVDSGGTLNGVLLRAGLVDELHLLVHPTLVGGSSQKTFFRDLLSEMGEVISLSLIDSRVEESGLLLLSYRVSK